MSDTEFSCLLITFTLLLKVLLAKHESPLIDKLGAILTKQKNRSPFEPRRNLCCFFLNKNKTVKHKLLFSLLVHITKFNKLTRSPSLQVMRPLQQPKKLIKNGTRFTNKLSNWRIGIDKAQRLNLHGRVPSDIEQVGVRNNGRGLRFRVRLWNLRNEDVEWLNWRKGEVRLGSGRRVFMWLTLTFSISICYLSLFTLHCSFNCNLYQ